MAKEWKDVLNDDVTFERMGESINGVAGSGMSESEIAGAISASGNKGLSFCFCGDSITDDSTSSVGWTDWGWVNWLRRLVGDSTIIYRDDVFAVASMGTAHLLDTQLPQVISGDYDLCFTMIGTNDLGQGVDIIGNLETFYSTLESHNIIGIAIPIMPHSTPNSFTDEVAREAESVNSYLKERAKSSQLMRYINVIDAITDYDTGDAVSSYLRDGIHNNRIGANVVGSTVYDRVLDLISGFSTEEVQTRNFTYDESDNPNGDWLSNGNLNGSGGTLQNGATGIAPDGWQFRRSSGAATFGLNSTRKTIDGYGNLNALSIEFSGTGDGNLMTLVLSDNVPSGMSTGDIVEFSCYLDISNVTGLSWLALRSSLDSILETDGGETSSNGIIPSTVLNLKLSTIMKYSGETTFEVRLQSGTSSGESLSGSIDVKKFRAKKIN